MSQLLACNSAHGAAPIMVNQRLLGSAIRMSEIIKVDDNNKGLSQGLLGPPAALGAGTGKKALAATL